MFGTRKQSGPPVRVEILGAADCPLCDEAKAVVAEVARRTPLEVIETDVRADPALEAEHGADIPVVLVDGHRAFKHRLTARALLARVDLARRARSRS